MTDDTSGAGASGSRSHPPTLAGILFIVAGLGSVAVSLTTLLPNRFQGMGDGYASAAAMGLVVIVGALGVLVGSVGAYIVLRRARFPHRSRLMSFVTIGIAVCYAVLPLGGFTLGFTDAGGSLYVISGIGAVLLLIFTVAAARNRMLPLGFRIVPVIQFVLVVLGYVVSFWTAFPVTGIAFLGAGTAYIVLAAHAREALEAAAAATPDERRSGVRADTPAAELPQ